MTTKRTGAGASLAGDDRAARIERVLGGYDRLMALVATAHAPELLEVGVTMSQLKVLYLVHATGELHMAELPGILGVSLSTVSGIVDRLVEQDLLVRREARPDRRQVVISLTEAGDSHLEHLRELNAAQLRRLLERLEPADLDLVERSLQILSAAAGDLAASIPAAPTDPEIARP